MQLTRRDALKIGAFGSAALVLPVERTARTLLQADLLDPRTLPPLGANAWRVPPRARKVLTSVSVPGFWLDPALGPEPVTDDIDYYELHMRARAVQLLPAGRFPPTTIWGYGGISPGPVIHAERRTASPTTRGRAVLVRHFNDLPSRHPTLGFRPDTSVHLHGNASLPQHDGYANDVSRPGQYKDYWFPTIEDARTLWYHDHGVHITEQNAYMGLAAHYHLHDEEEERIAAETGLPLYYDAATDGPRADAFDQYGNSYDTQLSLRDALFDTNGQLVFDNNSESSLMGHVNLVNGIPWPRMQVEPRQYRFRVLDIALSRSWALSLHVQGSSTRLPFLAVAGGGGISEFAAATTELRVGMAERYEIVIDFSAHAGKTLVMRNTRLPNTVDFERTGEVMMFTVGTTVRHAQRTKVAAGMRLREKPAVMALTAEDATVRRSLEFVRKNSEWTINGRTWAEVIASGFTRTVGDPKRNAVELWTLTNNSGGWFHPIHIHLADFRMLSRTPAPAGTGTARGIRNYEQAPKDVFYLGESEQIQVVGRFGPQAGRYMIHCHNLVHEDHDMMFQFWVHDERPGLPPDGYSPIDARYGGDVTTRLGDVVPQSSKPRNTPSNPSQHPLQLPEVPGGPQYPPAYPFPAIFP
jgi:spore coat protein A, manganese oxidase